MKALITGASSGIGYDMMIYLRELGYDIIAVARNTKPIELLVDKSIRVIQSDLSIVDNIYTLYNDLKDETIDLLINNAGFGIHGFFKDTDLTHELEMINVNLMAPHILTKLFLNQMVKRDNGHILNVASSAAFSPGPLMATYYASKSYLMSLSLGINSELNHCNSQVKVSVLCPGPVKTNFNQVAGVDFAIKAFDSHYVARYALNKMFKGKTLIIPGFKMKIAYLGSKILSIPLITNIVYKVNRKKKG